jgi:hypothetical protein
MKKCMVVASLIFLFQLIQLDVQAQKPSVMNKADSVNYPDVPRLTAYEAYLKYKDGKALMFQVAGISYRERHIIGAYNLNGEAILQGKMQLPKLPKKGIEIILYCY